MNTDTRQIKQDYNKYLRHALEQYDVENGHFPPEQDKDRLLTFDEYEVWWKETKLRRAELWKVFEQYR